MQNDMSLFALLRKMYIKSSWNQKCSDIISRFLCVFVKYGGTRDRYFLMNGRIVKGIKNMISLKMHEIFNQKDKRTKFPNSAIYSHCYNIERLVTRLILKLNSNL